MNKKLNEIINERKNKSFIVTGAFGNIGSYIVENLCKLYKNSIIACVDNNYNGNINNLNEAYTFSKINNNKLLFVNIPFKLFDIHDITNYQDLEDIFIEVQPSYVFHQASLLTLDFQGEMRRKAVEVNIMGTENILELCLKYNVKKLIYASSASVYGTPTILPTSETYNFNDCKLMYGSTKVANEFLAKSYSDIHGLKFVGLRYFNVYGPRQSTKNIYTQIVPKWIDSMIKNEPITIYGDGNQTMDMVYSAFVGAINIKAMENESCYRNEEFEGFINVASGVETSVNLLYVIIMNALRKYGYDHTANLTYQKHDPNMVKRRKADVTLMEKYLGKNNISVEEGIEMTVKNILINRGLRCS